MKKLILSALLVSLLLGAGGVALAQTTTANSQVLQQILDFLRLHPDFLQLLLLMRLFNRPTPISVLPSPLPSGCTSAVGYSPTTGQPCMVSSPSVSPTATPIVTTTPGSWQVVFIHPAGTPVPEEIKTGICQTVFPAARNWIADQARLHNIIMPFNSFSCDKDIEIPNDYFQNGRFLTSEGVTFQMPFDDGRVISYLESQPDIKNSRFTTVVSYLNADRPFSPYTYSDKYNVIFVKGSTNQYYPPLTADVLGATFSHEFMHLLGARDKYSSDPNIACASDPISGTFYSGYDIMCHYVSRPGSLGFSTPTLNELSVTDPTAKEISWMSAPIVLVRPLPNTILNYNDTVDIAWKNGVCPWSMACVKVFLMSKDRNRIIDVGTSFPNSTSQYWVTPILQSPSHLPPGEYLLGVTDQFFTSTVEVRIP